MCNRKTSEFIKLKMSKEIQQTSLFDSFMSFSPFDLYYDNILAFIRIAVAFLLAQIDKCFKSYSHVKLGF